MDKIKAFYFVNSLLKHINFSEYNKNNPVFDFGHFTTHLKPILKTKFIFRDLPRTHKIKAAVHYKGDRTYIFLNRNFSGFQLIFSATHELSHVIFDIATDSKHNIENSFCIPLIMEIILMKSLNKSDKELIVDTLAKHIILPTDNLTGYILNNTFSSVEQLLNNTRTYFKVEEDFLSDRIITEVAYFPDFAKKIITLANTSC